MLSRKRPTVSLERWPGTRTGSVYGPFPLEQSLAYLGVDGSTVVVAELELTLCSGVGVWLLEDGCPCSTPRRQM